MDKWLDDLYDLCDTVSREIGEANEKIRAAGGKLSGADIDYIDKLTHTLKSIKSVIMIESEEYGGESGYYPYYMDGRYRSYDNGDMRRGRSNAQRRDSRGRYSREDMVADLRELMRDAPDEHTRMKFQRFIEEVENA